MLQDVGLVCASKCFTARLLFAEEGVESFEWIFCKFDSAKRGATATGTAFALRLYLGEVRLCRVTRVLRGLSSGEITAETFTRDATGIDAKSFDIDKD
jgi:hypothetical protein